VPCIFFVLPNLLDSSCRAQIPRGPNKVHGARVGATASGSEPSLGASCSSATHEYRSVVAAVPPLWSVPSRPVTCQQPAAALSLEITLSRDDTSIDAGVNHYAADICRCKPTGQPKTTVPCLVRRANDCATKLLGYQRDNRFRRPRHPAPLNYHSVTDTTCNKNSR
jgi:hypothetical protein